MRTMTKPPLPEPSNIRLTITVTPEVHGAFTRMAQVSGLSLGRCMGEWLGDTLEGVQMVIGQLERAREAPRQAIREMRQQALGILDEADQLVSDARAGKFDALHAGRRPAAGDAQASRQPGGARPPRLVIRGGKSPSGNTKDHKPRGHDGL
jgi:hypothetical protein